MTASHESKRLKQLCQRCRDRKAKFKYRGVVRADRDHTLCFECHRSERNHLRAEGLAKRQPRPALTTGQVDHRRTMLTYLLSTARP